MIRLPFAARIAALFTRPCHGCGTQVGWHTSLCEACVDHLPVAQMWAYRTAHAERLRDPAQYVAALKTAREWLNRNPKRRDAATTSTAKETS